ncbi:MAG: hypothetical protein Q4A00_01380 [Flavobacteriaceae bacterium]|nr:hypothetical protein [Flavobacteriaceae bacterium]
MNKKIILSLVLAMSLLLVSCGRDEASIKKPKEEKPITPTTPKDPPPNPSPGTEPSKPDTQPNPSPSPEPSPSPQPSNPEEKPSEDDLRQRTYTNKWKVGQDVYIQRIDVADLYNNPEKITINVLKELAVFETQNGNKTKHYTLTQEELSHIEISNLKYDRVGKRILFSTKYKGSKSLVESSLPYDYIKFYERRITVNTEYVRNHYMRGTYQFFSIGNVLNIDTNIFEIGNTTSKIKSDGENKIDVTVELSDKRIKDNLPFRITKEITGFKTLGDLANDLQIAPSAQLKEKLKEKISKIKNQNNGDLTGYLKNFFNSQWKNEFLLMSFKSGGELEWNEDSTVLLRSGRLDIYLEDPRFILKSAVLEEKNLRMTVEFQQANEQAINKEYSFVVPGVK